MVVKKGNCITEHDTMYNGSDSIPVNLGPPARTDLSHAAGSSMKPTASNLQIKKAPRATPKPRNKAKPPMQLR